MSTVFEYLLYAAAFIAVILGIEGVAYLLRSVTGEERTIARRLVKTRVQAAAQAQKRSPSATHELSQALVARMPWLQRALVRADAPFNAIHLVVAAGLLFVGVFFLLNLVQAPRLLAVAAAAALAVGVPTLVLTGMAAHRRKRFLDQLPQAIDLIARSLQAGHPVTAAMSVVGQRMASPLGPEFRLVIEEMTYGLDREEALANLLTRFPVAELRMFVASLDVTRETGGNLAEAFLKLAEAIRAKDNLRRKVHAISAEGRMTFWVVSAMPVVVAGLLLLFRPAFFTDVAKDPLFWPMLSFAPVSLTIGSIIIWRMVNVKI